MSVYEVGGVIFALLSIHLYVKQSIWCWPTGLANNVLWIVMFYRARLYADLGLQVIYIVLGIYGWWEWLYGGENRSRLPVSRAPGRLQAILAAIYVGSFATVGFVLDRFTNSDVPYWDAIPNVLCVIAQWMLARKLLENWIVWIVANVIYMPLYVYKDLRLTAFIQIAFIALSVQGYLEWKKELEGRSIPEAA